MKAPNKCIKFNTNHTYWIKTHQNTTGPTLLLPFSVPYVLPGWEHGRPERLGLTGGYARGMPGGVFESSADSSARASTYPHLPNHNKYTKTVQHDQKSDRISKISHNPPKSIKIMQSIAFLAGDPGNKIDHIAEMSSTISKWTEHNLKRYLNLMKTNGLNDYNLKMNRVQPQHVNEPNEKPMVWTEYNPKWAEDNVKMLINVSKTKGLNRVQPQSESTTWKSWQNQWKPMVWTEYNLKMNRVPALNVNQPNGNQGFESITNPKWTEHNLWILIKLMWTKGLNRVQPQNEPRTI